MNDVDLVIESDTYGRLKQHLAGDDDAFEEAAFLFCRLDAKPGLMTLFSVETLFLPAEAFASRSGFYLELKDDVRASLIKKAHDLNCCLVEFHSHPRQLEAEFSWSDLRGFAEFVPHVRWRLKGRPYVAVVCGQDTFDSLVWRDATAAPAGVAVIVVANQRLRPTTKTLSAMRNER